MNLEIINKFGDFVDYIKAEQLTTYITGDLKMQTDLMHKINAYKKAYQSIKTADFVITSGKQAMTLPGVGKSSAGVIDKILNGEPVSMPNKMAQEILKMSDIIGIGPATIKKLVSEHGITSIKKLDKAIKDGTYKANNKIKLGLKYYFLVDMKIPRSEIDETKKLLESTAKELDPCLKVLICGSYRRGKEYSGDIDVLLYHPNEDPRVEYLQEYVKLLIKNKFIVDSITDKKFKKGYMGFSKLEDKPVRRIDIKYIQYESLAPAALYFTGPYELNVHMRNIAKSKNMLLNQYGLFGKSYGTQIELLTEQDIFNELGMEYLDPVQREEWLKTQK